MNARCQCSLIKFSTPTPKPLKIFICHCTECRHQSSSAFGIGAQFPYFDIPENSNIGIFTRTTLCGRQRECLFCKNCGARLLHRYRDVVPAPGSKPAADATVNVKAGCLEGLNREMLKCATHIWCKEAVVEIPEGVERWEEQP